MVILLHDKIIVVKFYTVLLSSKHPYGENCVSDLLNMAWFLFYSEISMFNNCEEKMPFSGL